MVAIKCRTFKPTDKWTKPKDLLIFGRVARIIRYNAEEIKEILKDKGYFIQCIAEDEDKTLYEIWTDYDAAFINSNVYAFITERNE